MWEESDEAGEGKAKVSLTKIMQEKREKDWSKRVRRTEGKKTRT